MSDPSRTEKGGRREDAGAPSSSALPSPRRAVRSIVAGDPATLVGDGFDGGLETGFRAIHATVAPKRSTSALEEPGSLVAGYRIVLRCVFKAEDD